MKKLDQHLKLFLSLVLLNAFAIGHVLAQNSGQGVTVVSGNAIQQDSILSTPFGTFDLANSPGSVFRISGDELRKTPGKNLSEALKGRVPGLIIKIGATAPGSDGNYSYTLNGEKPFVLVDGQPRGLQVDLREVQEVIVLNSATFNSLFGTLVEGGIIYVATKHAESSKPIVEVNYQRGISTVTRLPKTLNAVQYAKVINRASSNDGLGRIYSDADLQAYQNGSDPVGHPDIDYQNRFLENSAPSDYASVNIYGGKDHTSYSAFIGYNDWKGIEKIGQKIDGNNLTFRTKIRTKINDLLEAHGSVYGNYIKNANPSLSAGQFFNQIGSTPANAFPLTFNDTAYVVTNEFNNNLLAETKAGGSNTDYSSNMIFDFGLDLDFKDYIKGLTYKNYVMYRNYNAYRTSATGSPALYTLKNYQDLQGQDSLGLKLYRNENPIPLNPNRNNANVIRTFVLAGNFNYQRDMGQDHLNVNASHLLYYRPSNNSSNPDQRSLIFNANATYAFRDKYIVYANLNSSSSNKFINGNQTRLFPTVGLSWIASKENFLKSNDIIDYLKVRASYGVVGTEYTPSNYLYLEEWNGGGKPYLGNGNTAQNLFSFHLKQTANRAVDWIENKQFQAGIDLAMFKKLHFQFNYFNTYINGYISNLDPLFSDVLGSNSYLPSVNYTEIRNVGFNSSATYQDKIGEVGFHVGANVGYYKRINEKIAEPNYPNKYRLQQNRSDDLIYGYESDGLFTQQNIDNALPQFGPLQVGDIKYVDQNGDGVIDERDQVAIGNNQPRVNYGISLGFDVKRFNFDVVGAGVTGKDVNLKNIDYYTHSGLKNYFGSVNQSLPNGNPNPRLSAFKSVNNYQNSDYWLMKGGYFRISFVELGYSLPLSLVANNAVRFTKFKLFVRGSNLAVFSKFNDLDPEEPDAGVSKYPLLRNFTAGVSLKF